MSARTREQHGWRLTLGLLVRLGGLYVLDTVRGRAGNWRRYPFLGIIWLDGAQGSLAR
jgi:hypothetical protein